MYKIVNYYKFTKDKDEYIVFNHSLNNYKFKNTIHSNLIFTKVYYAHHFIIHFFDFAHYRIILVNFCQLRFHTHLQFSNINLGFFPHFYQDDV